MAILAAIAEQLAGVTQMIQELASALGGEEMGEGEPMGDPAMGGPGGPPPQPM